MRLREELDREREERNYFQLERDKVNTFWEITKRQLEEKKAELRNKDREMEDAEERHQIEIKVSMSGRNLNNSNKEFVHSLAISYLALYNTGDQYATSQTFLFSPQPFRMVLSIRFTSRKSSICYTSIRTT